MRRTGHIRARSAGSFEIRYSLGIDPATGKQRVVTATVTGTRKDAERELRRRLHAIDTGEHVDPHRITVAKWLADWLASVRGEVAPKTFERYGEVVNGYLSPALGNLLLSKLSSAHIQKAYNGWADGGRRDGKTGPLAPRTRRHIHRILNAALSRAVEQQLLSRNPADALKRRLPKVEGKSVAAFTSEQSAVFLDAIRHTHTYWPVLMAVATGMRRGEILGLRWKNLDLERGAVRVVESVEQTKAGLRFKAPKTERTRAVTLPAFAVAEFRRWKKLQAERLLRLGVRQTGETLVCCREDGVVLQPTSLTHQFTYLMSRAKDLPRIRFHDLRHGHATQLLTEGVHPKVVQERLGHSSIAITLDLYSHVIGTLQEDAAARLDLAFQPAIRRGIETAK